LHRWPTTVFLSDTIWHTQPTHSNSHCTHTRMRTLLHIKKRWGG
jgi:hypothetical protein